MVLQLTVSGGSKRRISASGPRDCEGVLCATCSPVTSFTHFFFLQRIYSVFLHNAEEKESITASREIQQEEKRE